MRIVVTGAGGTLGRAVLDAAYEAGHVPSGLTRQECDITSASDVRRTLVQANPAVVINAAGALPDRSLAALALANAAGPHVLADACGVAGVRLLHVSTDCVFDGKQSSHGYRTTDVPNAIEPYGLAKAYGEPQRDHVLVVRTSFVGLGRYGLLRHLLDSARDGRTVQGWRRSYWTGSTVHAVASALVTLAAASEPWGRILHLATERVYDKAAVCRMLIDALNLRVAFEAVDEPLIDRSLVPDVPLPGLERSIDRLVQEVEVERAAV